MSQPKKLDYWLLVVLALVGLGLSLYSLKLYTEIALGIGSGSPFCSISETLDCVSVNKSRYATFMGLPVAAWGIGYYLLLCGYALWGMISREIKREDLLFLVTSFSVVFSVYLFAVSKLFIGKLCPTCLAMYVVNIAAFFIVWRWGFGRSAMERLLSGFGYCIGLIKGALGLSSGAESRGSLSNLAEILVVFVTFLFVIVGNGVYRGVLRNAPPDKGSPIANELLQAWREATQDSFSIVNEGALEMDHSYGPKNAPIQIVEFADFECGACQYLYEMLHPLLREYEGKVRLTFKNFPLDQECNRVIQRPLHQNACYAAQFARCAGEQDKFWEAAGFLFTLKEFGHHAASRAVRHAIDRGAVTLGFDSVAIERCMVSGRQLARIKQDIEEGLSLEIRSTPTIWINGRRVERPSESLIREIFDSILKESQG